MSDKRIIITKDAIDYGDDIETLKELLPIMCLSIAYACRATGINPINAFTAASEIYEETKTLEEFGEKRESD